MYYFCTYFDRNYLTRGLALYHSLVRHRQQPFQLWILCFDDYTYAVLTRLNLSGVHPISQQEFEANDKTLSRAKSNRTQVEYYWTCTPSLPLFVLNNCPEVDLITYLDADLFFFADPAPLYAEIAGHSIAIIGHRFPSNQRHLERNGIYNVGWLSFKRDAESLACLESWRAQCIEWCYARSESGRFGDQKYLDDWPNRYQDLVVLQHKGANLAAWNIVNYQIRRVHDRVWVDDVPLIFFHFHGFAQIQPWLYALNVYKSRVPPLRAILQGIYQPYIQALEAASQISDDVLRTQASRNAISKPQLETRRSSKNQFLGRLNYMLELAIKVMSREVVFYLNGRVI